MQKFGYQVFCINFCDSLTKRRLCLFLQLANTLATLVFVFANTETTFNATLSVNEFSYIAVRVWFLCYMSVYIILYLEGFWKGEDFEKKYQTEIKEICKRHAHAGIDYYAGVIYSLLFLDVLYIFMTFSGNSKSQFLHNLCLLPKMTIRFRLWSYLYLSRSVLHEFKELIRKFEQCSVSSTEADFLRLQHEFSYLWKVSQNIGDAYVLSLGSITLYVFFDLVVYMFWLFTIEFAEYRYIACRWEIQFERNVLMMLYFQIMLYARHRASYV